MDREPPWEQGALDSREWETPLLLQEDVVSDATGVALVNRATFLETIGDYVTSMAPLAIILPGTAMWFREVERSDTVTDLLNAGMPIDFTYIYKGEDGRTLRPPRLDCWSSWGRRRYVKPYLTCRIFR